jgi:cytidylate kinase
MLNSKVIQAGNAYIASEIKSTSSPSRETGAGGTEIGMELVSYLNLHETENAIRWTLYDKNLIEKVIEEYNLPETFKNFLQEEKISEVQNTFERLMGLHPGISALAAKTCHTILKLASIGNVVIIGRGANIVTKNMPGGLHVRIISEPEWKIRRIESKHNIGYREAVRFIQEEDQKKREYVKKLFNKEVSDPLLYDMIIKTGKISPEDAVNIIARRVLSYKESLSTVI